MQNAFDLGPDAPYPDRYPFLTDDLMEKIEYRFLVEKTYYHEGFDIIDNEGIEVMVLNYLNNLLEKYA